MQIFEMIVDAFRSVNSFPDAPKCADCKWLQGHMCANPRNGTVPSTGKIALTYAFSARGEGEFGQLSGCSMRGRWFEPK